MTAKTQIFLKDIRDSQPDKLLETLEIKLTDGQRTYLQENRTDTRTLLWKKFNLKFSTPYSKMQITRALEVMNAPKIPTSKRNPKSHKNVYYRARQRIWEARITVNKVRHLLYRGSEEMALKEVAKFKKKHGIR